MYKLEPYIYIYYIMIQPTTPIVINTLEPKKKWIRATTYRSSNKILFHFKNIVNMKKKKNLLDSEFELTT